MANVPPKAHSTAYAPGHLNTQVNFTVIIGLLSVTVFTLTNAVYDAEANACSCLFPVLLAAAPGAESRF